MPSFTPYGSGSAPNADEPPVPPGEAPTLPVSDAEAFVAMLPGIISARIVSTGEGGAGEIHVLTGPEISPRQTVQNVESALFARFGVRVDVRRISVATTTGPVRRSVGWSGERQGVDPPFLDSAEPTVSAPPPSGEAAGLAERAQAQATGPAVAAVRRSADARRLYFEDVEARRSARGGLSCRVVLRRGASDARDGDALVEGEAESPATLRVQADEVAARAALDALARGEGAASFALEGSTRVRAFGREFVLVGVVARQGRGATLLIGSAEVRDGGAETAAVLAILDATNRWVAQFAEGRPRAA